MAQRKGYGKLSGNCPFIIKPLYDGGSLVIPVFVYVHYSKLKDSYYEMNKRAISELCKTEFYKKPLFYELDTVPHFSVQPFSCYVDDWINNYNSRDDFISQVANFFLNKLPVIYHPSSHRFFRIMGVDSFPTSVNLIDVLYVKHFLKSLKETLRERLDNVRSGYEDLKNQILSEIVYIDDLDSEFINELLTIALLENKKIVILSDVDSTIKDNGKMSFVKNYNLTTAHQLIKAQNG